MAAQAAPAAVEAASEALWTASTADRAVPTQVRVASASESAPPAGAALEGAAQPSVATEPSTSVSGTPWTAEAAAFVAALDAVVATGVAPPGLPTAPAEPVVSAPAVPEGTAATEAPASSTPAEPVPAPPATVATPVPTAVTTPLPVVAPPPPAVFEQPSPLASYSERARGLYEAMNLERVAAGMSPLSASAEATAVAQLRAEDMIELGYFAHRSPSGETWLHLVNAAGIPLTAGGENLAKISGGVDESVGTAIRMLMDSPTHAGNILSGHYDRVGVAAITTPGGMTIFVAIFLG